VEAALLFVFPQLNVRSSQGAVLGGATFLELSDEPKKLFLVSLVCSQNLWHHVFGNEIPDLFD
jgi:hypothetical protein